MTYNIVYNLKPETLVLLLNWNDSNGVYEEADPDNLIDQAWLIEHARDQDLNDEFLTTDNRVLSLFNKLSDSFLSDFILSRAYDFTNKHKNLDGADLLRRQLGALLDTDR